ncbi:MAG: MFS transporter [Anaerolineae bacterium]
MERCTHLDQIKEVTPNSEGCADCIALGDTWIHLRMCQTCGYVGCCDDSKNRHAARHFYQSNHPIVRSLEPGEGWNWCYIDEIFLEADAAPPLEAEQPDRSAPVVRNYLIIAGLYTLSTSVIWGVNTLFLLDAGLDIFGVFIANAVFTGSMAFFEIPTGVLADTRGRRASFLLSVAVVLVGTLGYVGVAAGGGGLLLFSLLSVVLGLGYTFYSGAVEAWLVDSLKATGYRGQLDRVFARGSIVSGAAMLIGSVGGGLLGNLDLSIPYLARAGLLAAVFAVAFFTMHDLGFSRRAMKFKDLPAEMGRIAQVSITYGWQQRPVRLLMVAAFVQSLFMAWGFYAWQPYFLELLGQDLTWVAGVIAALISIATMAGNSVVEWFTRYCGKRTTLLLWAAGIQTVAAVGVGLAGSFWLAVALYLVVMGTMGVWGPVRQAYMHQVIPSEQRASVISFDSLVSSSGSVFGQMGLGRLAQTQAIASGYIVGGLTTVLVLPVIVALRRLGEPADLIVGTAGKQGACAAQGLPNVSAVDTSTHVVTAAEA